MKTGRLERLDVFVLSGSQVCGAEERGQHRRLCRHPAGIPFSGADLPQRGRVQQVSGKEKRRRRGRKVDGKTMHAFRWSRSHFCFELSKLLCDQLLGRDKLGYFYIEIK